MQTRNHSDQRYKESRKLSPALGSVGQTRLCVVEGLSTEWKLEGESDIRDEGKGRILSQALQRSAWKRGQKYRSG